MSLSILPSSMHFASMKEAREHMGLGLMGFIATLPVGAIFQHRLHDFLGEVFLVGLVLYSPVRRKYHRKLLSLLLGMVWALAHSAPLPEHDVKSVEVVKSSGWGGKNLIVEEETGKRFFVRGRGKKGEKGEVFVRSHEGLLGQSASFRREIKDLSTSFEEVIARAREAYLKKMRYRTDALPKPERAFYLCLYSGTCFDLIHQAGSVFRELGIFHLIVVSGLHIGFAAGSILFFLLVPAIMMYSMRLIDPVRFLLARNISHVISQLLTVSFAVIVGFSSPVQRAVLCYLVASLGGIFWGRVTLHHKIFYSVLIQALVFPLGFWSLSNFLTWTAYLTIVLIFSHLKPSTNKFGSLLWAQFFLSFLTFAVFGQNAVLSFWVNIILGMIFPFVFASGATFLFTGESLFHLPVAFTLTILADVHYFVAQFAPFFTSNYKHLWWLRIGAMAMIFMLFLSFFYRSPIGHRKKPQFSTS